MVGSRLGSRSAFRSRCSDDLLRKLGKLAEKRGVGIIGHACENRDETVASHLKYGMGDIARLEKLGLLGPNMLLLHMGWVDPKELHMLQKRDVKISLAPSASMHQAMGNISHGKTPEMLELGLSLSLGLGFGHVKQLPRCDPAGVPDRRRTA